jgi:NAD-dependent DNA ligase
VQAKVSKDFTDLLIVGKSKKPGSKSADAKEHNIKTLAEAEFYEWLDAELAAAASGGGGGGS